MPKCNIFSPYLLSESPPWRFVLLASLGEYMPQVVPAQKSREVAPLMRHQSPVPNSQARGNGRKRSVYTVDCLVRFRNRYIDRFRLSQNGPPESLKTTRSIPSLRAVYMSPRPHEGGGDTNQAPSWVSLFLHSSG